jgi:hypothetical protein
LIETFPMKLADLVRAYDAIMAFRDATRRFRAEKAPEETALTAAQAPSPGLAGQIEARLTNVVVAALKEAFDRDHARLELERAQLEEQRRRAEEALRLEVRRQVLDRELGRLRMLAGTALVGWLSSVLVLGTRAAATPSASRIVLGVGWLLMLGALAAAFLAQGRINAMVVGDESTTSPSAGGGAALWLLIAGLALTAVSLLLT